MYLRLLLNKGEQVSYLVQCPGCLCVGVSPLCVYRQQAEQVKECPICKCMYVFPLCVYAQQAENVGQVKGLVAQCSVSTV